jgi:hypothetical protein
MACYNFVYAMQMLRQSIDFAEIEHDFVPIHKWANEVAGSCHGLKAIDARLNHPTGQDFLLVTLQLVAAGVLSPEEAIQRICFWLNNGQKYLAGFGLTFPKPTNIEDRHLESDFEDRISGPDN